MADTKDTTGISHHENTAITLPSDDLESHGWVGIISEARDATEQEHNLGLRTAFRMYPKAIFWSFVVSLVVIMEGYDTALMGSLYGFPAFQKKFGAPVPGSSPVSYQLEAKWQTALGLASPLGNIIGIAVNSIFTERFGHKRVLSVNLILLTSFIFITFFATHVQVLFVGQLLCGIPWGVFATSASAYASEVAPVILRPVLQTWIVMCWGIGQFFAWAVLDSLEGNTRNEAWKIPFGVQWVWPVIILPLIICCPESPWWLVRRGRLADAEKSIKRLSSSSIQSHRAAVALMVETTNVEKTMVEGARYIDCFKGTNIWRTEISCMAWLTQAAAGFAIAQYAAYFFEQAGLPDSRSYQLTLGQGGLALLFNIFSLFLTRRIGRRQIYLWGCAIMSINWFIVGFMALAQPSLAISYASATLYMLWLCLYQLTIGPIAFIYVGEASSTRLRSHTIMLARNAYNIWNIMSASVAPYILNPTAGDWKGKSAFLPAGLLIFCGLWGFFRLPETKGRTYEELDFLFEKRIGAREFAGYKLDVQADILEKGVFGSEKR